MAVAAQAALSTACCTFVPDSFFPDTWYTCVCSGAITTADNQNLNFAGAHVGSRTNANVTGVRFVDSQLDSLPANLFTSFPNLETVEANNVGLKTLNVGSLNNCPRLQDLRLGNNSLTRLDNGVLAPCDRLVDLILASNNIEQIGDSFFNQAPRLQRINLSRNQIRHISTTWFRGIDNLARVDLSFNKIEEIPPFAFERLGFSSLDLTNNSISYIGFGAFRGFGSYNTRTGAIDLANNQVRRLSNGIFGGDFTQVVRFDIRNNGLYAIERGFLNYFWEISSFRNSIYASGNVCVDEDLVRIPMSEMEAPLERCFANY